MLDKYPQYSFYSEIHLELSYLQQVQVSFLVLHFLICHPYYHFTLALALDGRTVKAQIRCCSS